MPATPLSGSPSTLLIRSPVRSPLGTTMTPKPPTTWPCALSSDSRAPRTVSLSASRKPCKALISSAFHAICARFVWRDEQKSRNRSLCASINVGIANLSGLNPRPLFAQLLSDEPMLPQGLPNKFPTTDPWSTLGRPASGKRRSLRKPRGDRVCAHDNAVDHG